MEDLKFSGDNAPEKDGTAGTKDESIVSRRKILTASAALASALPLAGAQAAQSGAAAPQGQGAAARRVPQGGTGPIKVLLITRWHPFERGPFYDMFDALGDEITWTHVDQPAAELFFNPERAAPYDVFVLYDMAGREPKKNPDGSYDANSIFRDPIFPKPSEDLQRGFKALLQSGNKGFVFFHHSLASWVHSWPEYTEVIGAAADWGLPITVRGKEYPKSGYRGGVQQHITVEDKSHPVVAGLGDGYDIEDETYLCPMFEDSVHCLLRTDFKPIDSNFPMQSAQGWHHPPGSNMAGWVKTAENTPIVYLQNGHGPTAWANPAFRKLMGNAIRWANSPEAKQWAKANPSKIFKAT